MTAIAFRFAGVWSQTKYSGAREAGLAPATAWSDDLYQWVHVEDVARGIRQALEADHLTRLRGVHARGRRYPLPGSPPWSWSAGFAPTWHGRWLRRSQDALPLLAIDKARNAFGYDPQFRLGD